MDNYSPHSTAYHEAGHAVAVSRLSGPGRIDYANVIQTGNRGGVTFFTRPHSVVSAVAVYLAGPLAQWYFHGRRGPVLECAGGDLRNLETYVGALYHGEPVELSECEEFRDGLARAQFLLRNSWGAVVQVAERLLTHKTISGALVDHIIKHHDQKRSEAHEYAGAN